MAIKIKDGVKFVMSAGGCRILDGLKSASKTLRIDVTITSGSDGVHSPNSAHYRGDAYDIRTRDLTQNMKNRLEDYLYSYLGPKFLVLYESGSTPNQHIHCQLKRNTLYTIEDYLKD